MATDSFSHFSPEIQKGLTKEDRAIHQNIARTDAWNDSSSISNMNLFGGSNLGDIVKLPGKLGEITGGSIATSSATFPSDLAGNHAMSFTAMKRDRPTKKSKIKTTILGTVRLPIPSDLQTAYNAQYEQADLGSVGATIAGSLTRTKNPESFKDFVDVAENFSKDLGKNSMQILKNRLLGSDSNIAKVVSKTYGIARNPHKATLFQGVNFRNHSFSYQLIARDQQESNTIKKIIFFFKHHMSTEYTGKDKHLFNYPEEFQISVLKPGLNARMDSSYKNNYINVFLPSVLTDFGVNYNGTGMPVFYEQTGAPVQFDISLSFTETNIITKEEIKKGA